MPCREEPARLSSWSSCSVTSTTRVQRVASQSFLSDKADITPTPPFQRRPMRGSSSTGQASIPSTLMTTSCADPRVHRQKKNVNSAVLAVLGQYSRQLCEFCVRKRPIADTVHVCYIICGLWGVYTANGFMGEDHLLLHWCIGYTLKVKRRSYVWLFLRACLHCAFVRA